MFTAVAFSVSQAPSFASETTTIIHSRLDGKRERYGLGESTLTILGNSSKLDPKVIAKFLDGLNHSLPTTKASDENCLPNNRWTLIQNKQRRFFCHDSASARFLSQLSADMMVITSP